MNTEPDLMPEDSRVEPAKQPDEITKQPFPWRLFFLLAAMTILATLLLIPYAIKLSSIGSPGAANNTLAIVFGSILQTVVLYWPLALLGLVLARQLALGAPYLAAISESRPVPAGFRRPLVYAAVIGFGMGVLLLLLAGVFSQLLPKELTEISPTAMPNALDGFMASIAAGINEEILLRLFLLSFFAWIIQRVAQRRSRGRPNRAILWTANILAAVIFGLLHLFNLTAMNVPITLTLVAYVVLLNGMAGLGFGFLYWTFGLESAMLAHFFTDIVLHVITVPIAQISSTIK